jgi:hypothetical protein
MRRAKPVQLDLFEPDPPPASRPARREERQQQLFRRLSRLLDGRLSSLSLTDNRRTILTVKPLQPPRRLSLAPAPLELRLHRSFLEAPDEALQAVAVFVSSRRGTPSSKQALAKIREHFSRYCRTAAPRSARRTVLRPAGVAFDLRELRDQLIGEYFAPEIQPEITWGKAGSGGRKRGSRGGRGGRSGRTSIQLGSYSYEDNLIRLHRALDHPRVPRYVLEAVIFHELLHAALPPVVRNGRRYVHTPEFREREKQFRQLERAEKWIERNLSDLLRSRGPELLKSRVVASWG